MKHKHYDLIIAWANGAIIQFKPYLDKEVWIDQKNPSFLLDVIYRIKPEPKPDLIVNALMKFKETWKTPSIHVSWNGEHCPASYQHNLDIAELAHIKFTFDGETDKLKSVELINK